VVFLASPPPEAPPKRPSSCRPVLLPYGRPVRNASITSYLITANIQNNQKILGPTVYPATSLCPSSNTRPPHPPYPIQVPPSCSSPLPHPHLQQHPSLLPVCHLHHSPRAPHVVVAELRYSRGYF
jgi:hypothetical protein